MKKITVMAMALTLCLGAAAQAATVEYTLYLGAFAQGPGTFKVTAKVSAGDNFGLASYGVQLVDSPTVTQGILTVDNATLRGAEVENSNGIGPVGFTTVRSADLTLAGLPKQDAHDLGGSQDTVTPTPHLIRGFGQTGGSIATALPQPTTPTPSEGNPWAAELVLATGTYVPASDGGLRFIGTPGAKTFANVFTGASGIQTAAATVTRTLVVPEPATMALAGMSLIGCVLAARRRTA